MSVLLLTNPYAPPQGPPPASQSGAGPVAAGSLLSLDGPDAIATIGGAQASGKGGSATGYAGTGAGAGGFASTGFTRPYDATPRSVVDAQVAQESDAAAIPDSKVAGIPSSGMPDPLPTSPFLKRAAS